MKQYIDKDALVAEMYKILDYIDEHSYVDYAIGAQRFVDKLQHTINTIEVKEVDLEKEITDYINRHYHIRFDETLERGNNPLTTLDFEEIAKHFFELGLKINQKGE